MDTRRAESFSDGVFAVAITVLVFNLLSIGSGGKPLTYRLLLNESWPQYAAYAIGFLTIGIMWLNHHTMLAHVTRFDRVTLVLNIFLLMGVVAMPFPTALVADNLTSAGTGGRVAAVSYGVASILISLGFSAMWTYVSAHEDALTRLSARVSWQTRWRFSAGLVGYIIGTLVAAFVSAWAALVIYGLVAIYYLFEHLPAPDATASAAGDAPAPD
ncbi:MAG TPA: TMEM175 family protein [Streptosporangiaceae bacterium]|jgi:uncharacterized membrane protein